MDGERDVDDDKAEEASAERPPVEFHNPFGSFDFEPTDGGQF